MAQDAGFKIKINAHRLRARTTSRTSATPTASTKASASTPSPAPRPGVCSPISALAAEYWSKAGATFKGFSTSGKNDKAGDPAVDALIEKARLEKDVNKQKSLCPGPAAHAGQIDVRSDHARYGDDLRLAWPAVRNYQTYRVPPGPAAMTHYGVWLDETKAPFTNG